MNVVVFVCVALFSYLFGSLSFAILVGRAFLHEDIRNHGSGNAGMTNILRTCGKKAALLCALGDISKGVIPVLVGQTAFAALGLPSVYGAYLAGCFAVLGHIFPLYFHFKGGKGVLTSAAIMALIDPISTLICFGIFLVVVLSCRIVSVSSITVAVCYPITTYFVSNAQGKNGLAISLCAAFFGVLIIYMHRTNIVRLIHGQENKFGKKKVS